MPESVLWQVIKPWEVQINDKWDCKGCSHQMGCRSGSRNVTGEYTLCLPPKKYQSSPALRNAAIVCLYWKLQLREITYQCDYRRTFLRRQQRVQTNNKSFVLPQLGTRLSIERIRKNLIEQPRPFVLARDHLCHFVRRHVIIFWRTTLTIPIRPDIVSDFRQKAKIIQRTIDSEVIRSHFQEIRQIVKPAQASGLSNVLVPHDENETAAPEDTYWLIQDTNPMDLIWETVVDQREMEKHLLTDDRESFWATLESPCGHGLIYDELTYSSLSPSSLDLLSGEFPPGWRCDD